MGGVGIGRHWGALGDVWGLGVTVRAVVGAGRHWVVWCGDWEALGLLGCGLGGTGRAAKHWDN